jgi:hypothetical protein
MLISITARAVGGVLQGSRDYKFAYQERVPKVVDNLSWKVYLARENANFDQILHTFCGVVKGEKRVSFSHAFHR